MMEVVALSPAARILPRQLLPVSCPVCYSRILPRLLFAYLAPSTPSPGGDNSGALTELRSYRVPPPITFGVLQCILLLSGSSDEDCDNWARMRVLTSYKLIKKLVTLKPAQVRLGAGRWGLPPGGELLRWPSSWRVRVSATARTECHGVSRWPNRCRLGAAPSALAELPGAVT